MNNSTALEILPPQHTLEIVPEEPTEVSWAHARHLWGLASRGAGAIVELALVLDRLRAEFFAMGKGGGGDRKSDAYHTAKITSSDIGRGCNPLIITTQPGQLGWEKAVRDQLGVSPQTARRLIERGYATGRIASIAEGEDVQWKDSKGEVRITHVTEETQRMAREILPCVVSGAVSATRAWAGLCGEGERSKAGRSRADVDYCRVMLRALVSLRNASQHWAKLDLDERLEVERLWDDVRATLPSTWRVAAQ